MPTGADFVISMLVEEGLLTPDGLRRARQIAAERSVPMLDALQGIDKITPESLAVAIATLAEVPYVRLADYTFDGSLASMVPRSLAEAHLAFPLFCLGGVVTVGMADPLDLAVLDQLRSAIAKEIEPVACDSAALRDLITRAFSIAADSGLADAPADSSAGESLLSGQEPAVAAVQQILAQAISEGASDVHFNPDEHDLHIRFRIDGELVQRAGPGRASHPALVQRLKVLAGLDVTQTRRPQDGKFVVTHHGRQVDVRLSILPTIHGENVVMRLLASGGAVKSFESLGFDTPLIATLKRLLSQPHGMFLVTGPTGSGKTTTLYAALAMLNQPNVNVMTIEDPVEIRLPMVRHVQINHEVGLTFADSLRAILRQDPDVVLVGEIRDPETARTAMQAALTGHVVLSTLHTNDAPGAVTRLRDLDCPAFAINAGLLGVLAQRLVVRACQSCSLPHAPDADLLGRFGIPGDAGGLVRGAGCAACSGAGTKGRLAVTELMETTGAIRNLVAAGAGSHDLRQAAIEGGMRPMWQDGLAKARRGLLNLEDVSAVVLPDPEELARLRGVRLRQTA